MNLKEVWSTQMVPVVVMGRAGPWLGSVSTGAQGISSMTHFYPHFI